MVQNDMIKFVSSKMANEKTYRCELCNKSFYTSQGLSSHLRSKPHKDKERRVTNQSNEREENEEVEDERIEDVVKEFRLNRCTYEGNNLKDFIKRYSNRFDSLILRQKYPFKYNLSFRTIYKHEDGKECSLLNTTSANIAYNANDVSLTDLITDALKLLEKDDERLHKSGWNIIGFNRLMLRIQKINVLAGESYIELPFKTKDLINVKNYDNKCFLWSILAGLYPATTEHPNRLSNYIEYENELNTEDLTFPVIASDKSIVRFEKKNNLSIYIYETKK